jgi:CubicO group peptidase (beta-lactamase class C family)
MASISKTFMATAIMQLWEKGLIDLDADINNYLPSGFTVRNPNFPNDKITVRNLMTHTSGIRDNWNILFQLYSCGDYNEPYESFLVKYFTVGREYYTLQNFYYLRPGQTFNYTNAGSCLLALIVENISSKAYAEYVEENIFEPLSMDKSSFFLKNLDTNQIAVPYSPVLQPNCHFGMAYWPIGQLRTNKFELLNYARAYLDYGLFNNNRILDSITVNEIFSDQANIITYWGGKIGLIWVTDPEVYDTVWSHTGGWTGCETALYLCKEERWAIILFHNYSDPFNNLFTKNLFPVLNKMAIYAHFYGNIYAQTISLNKQFVKKGIDSVFASSKIQNPNDHQFTANLIFYNSEMTLIDSVLLNDHGTHGDILLNDGIYSSYIPPQSTENFFKIDVSTIDHQTGKYFVTDNLSQFTTAGPLIVDSIMYVHLETQKRYSFRPYLKNEGSTLPINSVSMNIICNDPWVTNFTGTNVTFPTIQPGSRVQSSNTSAIYYDSTFPGYFNFKFEIASDNYVYWYDSLKLVVKPTLVEYDEMLPTEYKLSQNYPNPFNPTTKISYALPQNSFVELKVFNLLGQEIATLVNQEKPAGTYEVNFSAGSFGDASSAAGGLPSGVYIYKMKAGEYLSTKKMILLK